MTIKIFHSPFARSVRPRWLCLEMGLDHEVVQVANKPDYLNSDEYKAINPAKRIPAMHDGDVKMFESTAIMEYLLAKPGGDAFAPQASDPLYAPYLQWLHFGEAGMGMYVTLALGHNALFPKEKRIPAMAKYGERETQRCLEVLAEPLEKQDYLLPTGFSAADISVVYMLLLAKFGKVFGNAPDSVKAYFERCTARDGWKQATAD